MLLIILLSVAIRIAAMTWSVVLWRRLRDSRMGWLTAVLAFLTVRQASTLVELLMFPTGPVADDLASETFAMGTSLMCVLAVHGLSRMIADRDRATSELERARSRQEALLHAIPDMLFHVSRDGVYIDFAAPNQTRLLVPPEQFLGKKMSDVLPPEVAAPSQAALEAALATRRPQTFVYRSPRDPSRSLEVRTMASGPDEVLFMVRDISERRKAEESLRESESRFRMLADSAPVLIWMNNADNISTYYNRTWLDYTGRTLEDEIQDGWTRNLHPDDRQRCLSLYEECFASHVGYTMEYRFRRGDGSYGWLLDRGLPRFTPDGSFAGFIGSATDITAQKRAEEALAEREGRLRTIIQSEPECVKLLDQSGRVMEMNPAGLAMLEADNLEQVRGKRVSPIIVPEYRPAFEALTRSVFEGKSGALSFEVIGLKGTRRWLDTHAVPLRNSAGEITALLGITRDITERKRVEAALYESNARFMRIADHGAIGIWEVTPEGATIYANGSMCRMLEVDSVAQLDGVHFKAFFSPASQELLTAQLARRLRGESGTYEVEIVGARGGRRISVVSGAPGHTPGQPLKTFIATFTDITERKHLEDELRQAEEFSRQIVDTMPAGLVHIAADGRILRANSHAQSLLGLTMDRLSQRFVADFDTETIREDGTPYPASEYPVTKALATGKPQPPATIGVRRPNGTTSWAVFTATPLHDATTSAVTGAVVTFLDITQRKADEEILRQTADTLQSIIQTSPLAIMSIDAEGTVLAWNPAAERIFGWTEREVIGRPIPTIPEGERPLLHTMANIESGARVQRGVEVRRLRKDGSLIDVELWTAPQRDASGRIIASMGILADITERSKLQAELKESEDRYRQLVQGAPIGLFVCQDGRFVYANLEALRILGAQAPDDLLGRPVADRMHPDSRPLADQHGEPTTLPATLLQERLIRLDSSAVDVELASTPIVFKGKPATQVLARDITEQVRARQRQHATQQRDSLLVEQTPLAVIIWDTQARVLEWNPAAEKMFGYSVREAVGLHMDLILPEPLRGYVGEVWADLLAGRGGTRSTNENLTKAGKSILCEWYNARLIGATGEVIGVASLCQDVTESKRLEEELRRFQKMEAIGQLASGVAHDFGNLLTAIFGFTSLARRTLSPNHPAVRSLDRVDDAAKQASGVTKALLTFSRGGTSEKRVIRLGVVVDDAVRLLRRTLPANIEIRAGLDGRRPVFVKGDATQLQQVVLNLAINARDAMRSGGKLSIMVDSAPPTPGQGGDGQGDARLTVTDTGAGMTPEVMARIFEPFYTTKAPGEGTGLGLAIIHGIVKDHGGAIHVRSEIGKGSTFTVVLPAAEPESTPDPARRAPAIRTGKGELILLADSHPYIRELIASMLVSLEYQVIQCIDGDSLIERFGQNREQTRLVILDAEISGSSGRKCLAQIRAAGGEMKAILLAGQMTSDPAGEDPRTTVLPKPFQMNELAAAVAAALG